ncbi:DUF4864 domain-containing protein [uncultured Tateyamaria sp.]|uniref:DUF4864 domain-containing protein n=1 Tax=uncultured Tateyamaria sp. TaxID=455651 RepID=UPI0026277948|nr:DUF4864 domain-containing protein [uncultured Tateyamaria sp.]
MRKWMMGALLAASMTGAAFAQDTEIQGVIGNQIEAFKSDNFEEAFSFASPGIRGIFGTPENFGRMVTQGYPMVWRPAEVTYLGLDDENGVLSQTVRIVDADGATHLLKYRMLETDDGWKINGVQLIEAPGVSA